MKLILLKLLSGIFSLILLSSCASSTAHINPVHNFDCTRYLGTWYEIARLPQTFEDGLSNISATYSLRDDGDIDVVNRGFDFKRQKWVEKSAYAFSRSDADIGDLSVVFHWPFRGKYRIIFLDTEYRYAIVTGSAMSSLWILSRMPVMEQGMLALLIGKARDWGYDTGKLIIVNQDINLADYYNRDTGELPSELEARLLFE